MNRKILITGGATGIGKNLTKHFLSQNDLVIIISRSEKNVMQTQNELDRFRNYLISFTGDLASKEFVLELRKELRKIGNINYLINCAGVQGEISPFIFSNIDSWYAGFTNNIYAGINAIHLLLPMMMEAGYGKIISLAGGGATGSRPNFTSYAASKIAIVRFSEILADELAGKNVDVNMISPGSCNTRMIDEIIDAGDKAGINEVTMARNVKRTGGTPLEKITNLVSFLFSKEADGITGKIISAVWDDWYDPIFQEKLRGDKNFATLRRIDGRNF